MIDDKRVHLLEVRAFLLRQLRNWLDHNGYIEIQAPILVPLLAASANSFKVKYYDRSVYLTKGFLPYGMSFADRLKKVYTISPGFRQERPSNRHLSEYWRLEVVKEGGLDEIIGVQEELITSICSSMGDLKEALSYFNRSWQDLEKVKKPFDRMTYDEAIEALQKDGHKIWWGQEISWDSERHLSLKFERPFFITKYPFTLETFFSATDPQKPELSLSADLLAPEGYGEIASISQIITNKKTLLERLKEAEVDRKAQTWFTGFMTSCPDACSGFAMGVERLLQWICKLPDIKEASAYPRTSDTDYP